MKKAGIITFHASHNYGSMLQAYALQETIKKFKIDPYIIDFQLNIQKFKYLPFFEQQNQHVYKKYHDRYPEYCDLLIKRKKLFENFKFENFKLTEQHFSNLSEIEKCNDLNFDYFISGSDQIWNTSCFDFSWAYFLSFVKSGKKIAYSPSMGPHSKNSLKNRSKIAYLLNDYSNISVRDKSTADFIRKVTKKYPKVLVDPTFLLSKEEWMKIIKKEPLIRGDYIFLYSPGEQECSYKLAENLSRKYSIPVVICSANNPRMFNKYSKFIKYLNTGPSEFLNLIFNSTFICGYSFHLYIFATLFHKSFYSIKGMDDDRISTFLKLLYFEDRNYNDYNSIINMKMIDETKFVEADKIIINSKKIAIEFLTNALI